MASETPLLDWYCRPDSNSAWIALAQSAFGAYTPCAAETLVVSLSYFILWCLICYRIYLIRKDSKVFSLKRFCLQSRYYNYGLALLAAYNTAEPLFRAVMGLSVVNLDGQASLPPFEETMAVALAYGIYKTDLLENDALNVVFVDIGDVSIQVCVVAFKKGLVKILAHGLDRSLGGRHFDEVLLNYFLNQALKP